MFARGLQQDVRALHVGHDERLGAADRPVDMRLGGEVHDRVAAADGARDGRRVLDRAVHEADVVDHVVEVLAPAGIGQLVEHGHLVAVVGERAGARTSSR